MPADLGVRDDEAFWRALRTQFTIPADQAFFNTATLGSSPRVVQDAVIASIQHIDRDIADWDYKPDHENFFTGYYPEMPTRDKLATTVNCTGRDIALTQNATFGMNFIANGLDLKAGRRSRRDQPGAPRRPEGLRSPRQARRHRRPRSDRPRAAEVPRAADPALPRRDHAPYPGLGDSPHLQFARHPVSGRAALRAGARTRHLERRGRRAVAGTRGDRRAGDGLRRLLRLAAQVDARARRDGTSLHPSRTTAGRLDHPRLQRLGRPGRPDVPADAVRHRQPEPPRRARRGGGVPQPDRVRPDPGSATSRWPTGSGQGSPPCLGPRSCRPRTPS